MAKLGVLNKAWDGAATISFDRADDSLEARNPRVTVSYMVQAGVFEEFMGKRGGVFRSSGHLARYLVSEPVSTQGSRYKWRPDDPWCALPRFHERLREILMEGADHDIGLPPLRSVLEFSPEAEELWLQTQNSLEGGLRQGGHLATMKDSASKSLEIAGRVAGLLHFFCQLGGDISMDTLKRSIQIVHWHSLEFGRLFGEGESTRDVRALANYLLTKYWHRGFFYAPRNDVRKCGPIRHQGRFEAALHALMAASHLSIILDVQKKRTIQLNPAAFQAFPQLEGDPRRF